MVIVTRLKAASILLSPLIHQTEVNLLRQPMVGDHRVLNQTHIFYFEVLILINLLNVAGKSYSSAVTE